MLKHVIRAVSHEFKNAATEITSGNTYTGFRNCYMLCVLHQNNKFYLNDLLIGMEERI